MFKKVMAALAMLMMVTLAGAPAALAHSEVETGAGGQFTLNPKAPVGGQPTELAVTVVADDGDALTGGTMTGKLSQAGQPAVDVTLTESPAGSGRYQTTVTLAATDWHGQLTYENGKTKLVTDFGFNVYEKAGETFGVRDSHLISWRQPGVTTAPAWTDTATWVLLVALPPVAAFLLWRKQGAGASDPALLRKPADLVPAFLLTLAAIGAIAMPFSGYWDISWHIDQGRDGLLSPPHLGIYGGITLALASLGIGVIKAGGIRQVKQFPALVFAMAAMVVQLSSAPLDELWHRLMGLDISVWAPPHNMLIFGSALASIGMAAIQAAADPAMQDRWARLRVMTFGVSGLWVLNAFLAEFEFLGIPAWHISQSRPAALYPTLLALSLAATLIPAARMLGGKWTVTRMALAFWVLRALQIALFLPALGRTQPVYPALVVLAGAVAADLAIQGARAAGRYRYAIASAVAATAMLVLYLPLSLLLPVKTVPASQLLVFGPLAVVVAGATGYLAGWLGDFALQAPQTRAVPSRRIAA